MKNVFQKVLLIIGMIFLSTGSVFGQKVSFSLKEAFESLKRDNQCSYCTKMYQFSTEARQIVNIANKLNELSGKKKDKKFRRFQKSLDEFITNSSAQHNGLAKELIYSKEKEQGKAMKDLIKLQGYLETISQLFKENPELFKKLELEEPLSRISNLNQEITTTLKIN